MSIWLVSPVSAGVPQALGRFERDRRGVIIRSRLTEMMSILPQELQMMLGYPWFWWTKHHLEYQVAVKSVNRLRPSSDPKSRLCERERSGTWSVDQQMLQSIRAGPDVLVLVYPELNTVETWICEGYSEYHDTWSHIETKPPFTYAVPLPS